ncbi:alpha/beta fold hydrolase [Deinococcus sp. HMF7620]|uniref:Alpha/beta fold hydrolase n=2 Tax=Deinococcus arboris TaxID=2682977 RepID=A0A7C9HT10_9DEIO|nr:alpha/beta fold hydrolase [Deinococcus arboris]
MLPSGVTLKNGAVGARLAATSRTTDLYSSKRDALPGASGADGSSSKRERLAAPKRPSQALATVSGSPNAFPVRRAQVQVNGEPFHVIEQGQGPAVLFCHGFPDTAETWRSQMRAVAEAGYRAVALDMRGYGASYAPADVSLYTSLHIVGDLVGVLDALEIQSAVLVGHDWGADYAQRAMVMRPDRFRALVSLSIPYAPRGEISLWEELRRRGLGERYYAANMIKPEAEARYAPAAKTIPSILYWLSASPPPDARWDPLDPARGMLRPSPMAVPSWADPDYVQHTIRSFEKTGFQGGLNYYRVLQITFDLTAAFKNAVIHQPSLYLYGAADGLCQFFHPTPPTPADLRQAQPGLVDVIRLEHAGHWPQHEEASRVNAELIKFLGTIGAPQ